MSTPESLLVDTEKMTRSLFWTPELEQAMPELYAGFYKTDEAYIDELRFDRGASYLRKLANSCFSFPSGMGGKVHCSLLYEHVDYWNEEMLVMWAPFSDGPPQSDPVAISRYLSKAEPNFIDKQRGQPNSWNQMTKSASTSELLRATGKGMPVLTIFSPLTLTAYDLKDRAQFWKGDFAPAINILEKAVAHAQDIVHGLKSESRLSKLHIHGASLGAHNAIASASEVALMSDDMSVISVTAQELILGPQGLVDLAARFTIKKVVGEPSDKDPEDYARIPEPALHREINAHGNELKMVGRMLKGMSKISYMKGLSSDPESSYTLIDIENLLHNHVPVTVALAENSGLTRQTADNLLKYRFGHDMDIINIKAIKDQKVGHLADEHVALMAAVIALGIKRSEPAALKP